MTIFCGSGCADAHGEVVALAEKLQAPVGYSFRGKEWVECDNPNAVGMSGLLGWGAAYKAMHDCDVLLLLGTDFPYETFMPTNAADRTNRYAGRTAGPAVASSISACAATSATRSQALLPLVKPKTDRDVSRRDARTAQSPPSGNSAPMSTSSARGGRSIPSTSPPRSTNWPASDAVFTMDTGMCAVWGARYLRAAKGRRFLGSFNHGSMANALPQAIGAQATYPGRQVISLSGDGGLAMLMGELLTLPQYELPIKIVVFNNHRLGMVQMEMEVAGLPHFGCELKNPNFAALAQAVGLRAFASRTPPKSVRRCEKALLNSGPALVDVVTDPNVLAMPPKATIKQAKGFALAMTKMAFTGEADDVLDTVAANWKFIK